MKCVSIIQGDLLEQFLIDESSEEAASVVSYRASVCAPGTWNLNAIQATVIANDYSTVFQRHSGFHQHTFLLG
jgi:hypothetical protein